MIATLSAAFYVGAVIGSIAVATGRTFGSGVSLADIMWNLRRHGLYRSWLADAIRRSPGIYDTNAIGRKCYRSQVIR